MDHLEQGLYEIRSTCAAHKWGGKAGYGECRDEIAIVKCCATCGISSIRGGSCTAFGIIRGCSTGKWVPVILHTSDARERELKPFDLEKECFATDLYRAIQKWNLGNLSGTDDGSVFSVMMASYETLTRIKAVFPDVIERRLSGID
jgi:hypothetical protein